MNGNPRSADFHYYLLKQGTREQIIEWLIWNDSDGCFSDEDALAEGLAPLTYEEAREIFINQIEE